MTDFNLKIYQNFSKFFEGAEMWFWLISEIILSSSEI